MGGHERPCKLVPSLGNKGMDFMTGFTQSPTVGDRVWTRN